MKRRFLLLLPALLAINSCGKLQYTIKENNMGGGIIEAGDNTDGEVCGFNVRYLYETKLESTGRPLAVPYFDSSRLGRGFENVTLPNTLIGGDFFMFYYKGTLLIQESYPGTIVLEGTVTSYIYERAKVNEFTKTSSASWSDIADYELWDCLSGRNVILDKEGHYVPLSEYKENKLYVTRAAGVSRPAVCLTPDCHELQYTIGALYAYEPDTSISV